MTLLSLLVAVPLTVSTAEAAAPAQLLHPATFHAEEVSPAAAGSWLGLVASAQGWSLQPVNVAVDVVKDPIVDEGGARTGRQVRVDGTAAASWLLRHPGLVPSEALDGMSVRPVEFGERQQLGSEVSVSLDGAWTGTSTLRLTTARGTQVLVEHAATNDARPRVLWAGDLDGDGAMDLIIDETYHYNLFAPSLWLSSAAKDGQLVGKVAEHHSVGC